jgi:hypothetical protein
MKLSKEEKRLLELSRKMESPKCKENLLIQAEAMVRAQEALKADYGLVGPDAPLFNGLGPSPAV